MSNKEFRMSKGRRSAGPGHGIAPKGRSRAGELYSISINAYPEKRQTDMEYDSPHALPPHALHSISPSGPTRKKAFPDRRRLFCYRNYCTTALRACLTSRVSCLTFSSVPWPGWRSVRWSGWATRSWGRRAARPWPFPWPGWAGRGASGRWTACLRPGTRCGAP